MMVIDKVLVNNLLDTLKTAITKIRGMDVTLEKILEDEDSQDLVDRRMQVAIETCINIATHLASAMELPRKEKASDIFLLLGENGVIVANLAEKMAGAVGFRNILIHEYTDIDYKLAYSDLDEKLNDLKEFAKQVLEFLEKQG